MFMGYMGFLGDHLIHAPLFTEEKAVLDLEPRSPDIWATGPKVTQLQDILRIPPDQAGEALLEYYS